MQRLSSKSTFISRRLFPIFWFGFLAVFFVIAPLVMAVIGFVVIDRIDAARRSRGG